MPATVSLAAVFAKAGLKVGAAEETLLTANQGRESFEAKKKVWATADATGGLVSYEGAQERVRFDAAGLDEGIPSLSPPQSRLYGESL